MHYALCTFMNASLKPLTEGIYALSGDIRRVRPWLGVVVTATGTVLIDSGNGPIQIALLQEALATIQAPPVTHILLTHHHWDHVFGSCYLPGATVIAHEKTQYHLNVMATEPWSAEYNVTKAGESKIRQTIATTMNAAIPDWTRFQAIPASQTFTDRFEIEIGGYHFEMTHFGGLHEKDSIIVRVTPGNVLFVGDIPYGSVRGDHAPEDLRKELDAIVAYGADWIVEGHRRPMTGAEFAAWTEGK
jgi:glyoxylase-like metal-dependent hydrolase (beta-lactamase superfamily II)